jgi:predicted CopG family antitoxin
MVSKTISVRKEVYELLEKMKLPGESFGDTISRLARGKTSTSLRLWARTSDGWADLTDGEVKKLEETLEQIGEGFDLERVDLS